MFGKLTIKKIWVIGSHGVLIIWRQPTLRGRMGGTRDKFSLFYMKSSCILQVMVLQAVGYCKQQACSPGAAPLGCYLTKFFLSLYVFYKFLFYKKSFCEQFFLFHPNTFWPLILLGWKFFFNQMFLPISVGPKFFLDLKFCLCS